MGKYLACRYCHFRVFRWRTNKKGEVKHGYAKLLDHVQRVHETEYENIVKLISIEGLDEDG